MVSDSGLHDLFEGIVDSPPHKAVDVNVLYSKPDLLHGEVLALQEKERDTKSKPGRTFTTQYENDRYK